MHIKELTINEFNEYQQNHPLSSFYQTINYGMLMAESGYDYDLIGYVDEDNHIYGASLILIKRITNKYYYGYAPRGFLIDYSNDVLLKKFTDNLKNYYKKKNVVFIKVNPEIAIAEVNTKNFNLVYNVNKDILPIMERYNYKRLKSNLYFESMLPRFNAFIKCKNFNLNNLEKNTKNKIKKATRKGLVFEKASKENLEIFYQFIKNKKNRDINYYKDYFTVFEKDNDIDLLLVKLDYNRFLINSQKYYEEELERNNHLNEKLLTNNNPKLINKKMNSDKALLTYKTDILEATKGVQENVNPYIAGAIVVKHKNKAYILLSGYDIKYKRFAPNYFLHYSIINMYFNDYSYIDLNGITGDFTNANPYDGLNRFKLSFKPRVYEFIGEFDLIFDEHAYRFLLKTGALAKEFNKK